jgi:hypothetical protein
MTDIQLSLPERATLIALMTIVGEVSNKDLHERYGFTLVGKDRLHLAECGYVSTRKGVELPGRPFVHELTELGWSRARRELAAAPPPRAAKAYRLLYGLANAFDRYMTRTDRTLADVFAADEGASPDAAETPVDVVGAVDAVARIRAAYAGLADKAGAPVRLLPLRERLADLPSTEFDAALLRLIHEPGVFLEPEPKLRSLTDADRKAAVRVGGEVKHLLSIEPS